MNQEHDYKSVKSRRRGFPLKIGILSMLICLAGQLAQANEGTIFLNETLDVKMQSTVTGTVTDDTGSPLPGASVVVKGTTNGTQTDFDGNFTLDVNGDATLVFSYIGFKSQEIAVNGNSVVNATLLEDAAALDEVIVTGYSTQTRGDLTGSVASVDISEATKQPLVNVAEALEGRVTGVTITNAGTPGGNPVVRIRGFGTPNNNNPLYIIDGLQTTDPGILNNINPADIAQMNVLKDGAASIYGARASNGVIVITTKDGNESSGLGVSYNTSYFVDSPFALPDFQNSFGQGNSGVFEFVDGLGGGINDNITYSWGPQLDAGLNIAQFDSPVTLADGRIVRGADTALYDDNAITPTPFVSNPDNLKNFYETGSTIINNISIGNQNEFGSFRLSLTDMRSDSYIPGVNLDRQTISGRFNFSPSDRLTINSSVNYIYTTSDNRPASGYGSENINYSLVAWMGRQTNTESLRNYWQPGLEGVQQYSFNYTFFDNPYFILLENRNAFDRNRIFGNISATYQISEKLSVMLRTGLDQSGEDRTFRRSFSSNRFSNGAYAEHNVDYRESNTDILINYNDRLTKKVGLDISVGANRLDQSARTLQTQAIGLAQPGIFKLSNAASPLEVFQFDSDKRINSIYGLLKFSYDDYFYLDITGRNDWSSALATPQSSDNTGFFYPSVSASLLLSKIVNLPEMVSFLKVRASWAQVGNDTNPYQTVGVFQPQTPVGGNPTFSEQTFIANQNLLPEQATAIELGFDFRLLDE